MDVEPVGVDGVEKLADLWVALAREQRDHGSHLLPAENRAVVQEALARYAVVDGLRVARDPDVVGFVMYELEGGRYEQDVRRGVVRNLYVRPSRRDEGVGTALLEAAERELADAGADVVALETLAANDAARRLYERCGYDPHRVEYEKRVESDTREGG